MGFKAGRLTWFRLVVTKTAEARAARDALSESGQGGAKWMNKESPIIGYSYDVELDTDKTINEVLKNISHQKPEHVLTIDGDKVIMFGILESIEDDGIGYLRLSPDCLIMVEVGDKSLGEGESVLLEIERSDLEVTAHGSPALSCRN